MAAQPIWLHASSVDALADDLLCLLERINDELPPVMSDLDKARHVATKHVIGEVCDVIDRHLFKDLKDHQS